jgi:NAD+ synthase (glutamine-hydrolysing)
MGEMIPKRLHSFNLSHLSARCEDLLVLMQVSFVGLSNMNHLLRVLSISPKIHLGRPLENLIEHIDAIKKAAYKKDMEIILFPELSITGYTCGDYFTSSELIENSALAVERLVEATKSFDQLIIFGAPIRHYSGLYNCAVIAFNGRVIATIPKTHLPNYNEFYDARWFRSERDLPDESTVMIGKEAVPMGQRLLKLEGNFIIGVEICEDLWSNEAVSDKLYKNGAQVVLNLSASNEIVGKAQYRRKLIEISSARNLGGYCYCSSNSGESSSELVFSGHKLSAELGKILTDNVDFQDSMTWSLSEFDLQKIETERNRINTFMSCRSIKVVCVEKKIPDRSKKIFPEPATPFIPIERQAISDVHATIDNILKYGLIRRINHTGCKKVVIGISGGLDSTLALLALVSAYRTIGKDCSDILAVSMPGPGTGSRTRRNAQSLAASFGCNFREISIVRPVEEHLKEIGLANNKFDRTYENIQARFRTLYLMNLANEADGIVLGTGDLSESALGWCTYSGDHISMYHINAGIPKTLVKFMVAEYAERPYFEKARRVLFDIIDTPISPELLPVSSDELHQRTELIIGDFLLNDFFIYNFLRYRFSYEKLLLTACQTFEGRFSDLEIRNTLDGFMSRFFSNQFKRNNSTEGPKVGSVSLSPRGDWRMPSDMSWKKHDIL